MKTTIYIFAHFILFIFTTNMAKNKMVVLAIKTETFLNSLRPQRIVSYLAPDEKDDS